MIDISSVASGEDLGVLDTETPRATNILSVQIGSLEYAPTLGIDLAFFLGDNFTFQDASFKAYLIQVLAQFGINVTQLIETVNDLFNQYTFVLQPDQTSTAMIGS